MTLQTYTLDRYLGEVAQQHRQKPKFIAWASQIFQRGVDIQKLAGDVCKGFDLNTASGAQLDAIGAKIGLGRVIKTPILLNYLTFDEGPNFGYERSVWSPFDPTDVPTKFSTLTDTYYRLALYLKTYINKWDGTKDSALQAYKEVFAKSSIQGIGQITVVLTDNFDMTASYVFNGVKDITVAQLLKTRYLLFLNMGVGYTVTVTGY